MIRFVDPICDDLLHETIHSVDPCRSKRSVYVVSCVLSWRVRDPDVCMDLTLQWGACACCKHGCNGGWKQHVAK